MVEMETISALHNAICYLDGAYSKVKDRRIEVHSSNSGEYGDKTGKIHPIINYLCLQMCLRCTKSLSRSLVPTRSWMSFTQPPWWRASTPPGCRSSYIRISELVCYCLWPWNWLRYFPVGRHQLSALQWSEFLAVHCHTRIITTNSDISQVIPVSVFLLLV